MSRSMYSFAALLTACVLLPLPSLAQLSFEALYAAQVPSGSEVVAHGDFNNDGREDFVVATYNNSSKTYIHQLYLSDGNGGYEAAKSLPALLQAVGDFNHDGNLDFATVGISSYAVSVYLGNGDGTFQPPRTFAGPHNGLLSLMAVDLNHDSRTDLIEVLNDPSGVPPTTMQLWISNGDGTFSKGQTIVGSTGPLANDTASGAVTGDFDGDGKPDIALLYGYTPDSAKATNVPVPTTVQVWYGDGAGNLDSPHLSADPNKYADFGPIVADLNNDGRSDIVAVPSKISGSEIPALSIFTGNSNRTLSYKTIATTECAGQMAEGVTVGDIDGDGRNDLVYDQNPCAPSTSVNTEVVARLGTGSGSFGPEQLIYQNLYQIGRPYAVRTSGTLPDLIFDKYNGGSTDRVEQLFNGSGGDFPGCILSGMAEGVQICSPGKSATSPVTFSVAAAGPTPMRTAAVWADGKKVAEQLTHAFSNYSFLDASIPLAAGSHAITVYGTGWDGTIEKKSFTLAVASGGPCSGPTSAGVHVCAPTSGAIVTSPVQIQAHATVTGAFARMEVWVDGIKKYTENASPTLDTTLSVFAGSHRFAIIAVNTAGTKWEQVGNAMVK